MKIEHLVLTHVRVPLVEPFRISSGAVDVKDAILIELYAEGLIGLGESSPMAGSFYSSDTPEQSWRELCSVIAPAVLNRDFDGPQAWNRTLDMLPCGNFTKAGVETAFWDLTAKRERVPLHELLGGVRTEVESGLAVGLYHNVDDMLRTVDRYLADGYKRVKLKIEPGRDIDVVRAARSAFGDIPLYVDANGAYSLQDLDVFRALDDFGLMMFEQPLPGPALQDMAEMQHALSTPICLDESLESALQLQDAISLGSFRIANFKIQRVGGFYRALEMHQICRERSIPAWVGTMPELGIGQAQGAALASLDNFYFPTDVEASARWFCDDIISPYIEVRDGLIQLPEGPGLGYSIDYAKVQQYTVATRSFPE